MVPVAVATRVLVISYKYPVAFLVECNGVLLLKEEAVGLALSPLFPMPCSKRFSASEVPADVGVGETVGDGEGTTDGEMVADGISDGVTVAVSDGLSVKVGVNGGVAVGTGLS